MANISEKTYGNVVVVQNVNRQWGVVNVDGSMVVPFGKYDWIDGFDSGLARVKIGKVSNAIENNGNKWGIINDTGKVVLPIEYDNIWSFYEKGRFSTRAEQDGHGKDVYFSDLNPMLPDRKHKRTFYKNDNSEHSYGKRYGEYAGSYAQDVMGYCDDLIGDAFDGEADAYWNID